MKLITRTQKAALASERWYKQYTTIPSMWDSECAWFRGDKKTRRQVHEELIALGPHPYPEDVNKAIGNTSWTDCCCDECGNTKVEQLVQLGQDEDYESSTANICFPCLKKAVKLKCLA